MYSVLGTWGTPVFLWTESYNGGIEIREALAQIFREFSESFMIRECDKVLLQKSFMGERDNLGCLNKL